MAKKRQSQKETIKEEAADSEDGKNNSYEYSQKVNHKGKSPFEDLMSNTDQIGSLLNKGLNLVEASLGLGINLVTKIGTMVQTDVINRGMNKGEGAEFIRPDRSQGKNQGNNHYPNESDLDQQEERNPEFSGIINRSSIFSGGKAHISFSINNESSESQKAIKLNLEGIVGESSQYKLDPRQFTISPNEKVIAPMDFDKFTLSGDIPLETPEDTYHGWVIVTGDDQFKIPVVLIVNKGLGSEFGIGK